MVTNDETVRCATIAAMLALVEYASCYCWQDNDGDLNVAIVRRDRRRPPDDEWPNCDRAYYGLGPQADGIQGWGCDDAWIGQHVEDAVALYEVLPGLVAVACADPAPPMLHGAREVPHGAG